VLYVDEWMNPTASLPLSPAGLERIGRRAGDFVQDRIGAFQKDLAGRRQVDASLGPREQQQPRRSSSSLIWRLKAGCAM
jgi:hypothetical protein